MAIQEQRYLSKCDRLKVLINQETDPKIKQELEVEKEVHLRKAEVFYNNLKLYCEECKADEFVETLTFDFHQNFPLPHIPSGDVYYKRQLWSYNFCIFLGKTGKSYHFMYDETIAKKGKMMS